MSEKFRRMNCRVSYIVLCTIFQLAAGLAVAEPRLVVIEATTPNTSYFREVNGAFNAVRILSDPLFDWRQLQCFGIDESRLPTGSEIRFRPPTAWGNSDQRGNPANTVR